MLDVKYPEWQILGNLGIGGTASVLKVQNPDGGKIYAMKVSLPETRDELKHEIDIYSKLLHPNIIQYVNSFNVEISGNIAVQSTMPNTQIAILLEFAEEDLLRIANKSNIEQKLKWSRELISALVYLKEKEIIHRDIKLNNVLIQNKSARLADFGTAIDVDNLNSDVGLHGTAICQSPEVIKGKPYSYASDAWSLGILIFRLLEGTYPWNLKEDETEYYRDVLTNPPKLPSANRLELQLFLAQNPNERLPIEKAHSLKMFLEPVGLSDLDKLRRARAEFGKGTREEFYCFLARMYPDDPPMSLNNFRKLYDRLY